MRNIKKEKSNLKEYSIPLVWSVWGRIKIQAYSQEEAIKIAFACETPLPATNHYIDDSLVLDDCAGIEVSDITNI